MKLIKISNCSDCPHVIYAVAAIHCEEAGRRKIRELNTSLSRLKQKATIPDWCPLDDARLDGEPAVKDFGWANGWDKQPEMVKECRAAGHTTLEKALGMHDNEVRCDQCGYVYRYNSS